ncbi:DNA-directed DNA polymerase [[Clostridium] sordellii]|uniref:DNA-directed DNA polymerase n=1 Tax=Paraclostridium sordellii TaxID=1505 RepID=A0ABM9RNH8_PARSO|nr:DNA polymerase [Paeniclostridium sordellii]CEJ73603.1 DNA polymerase A family protein [[Clostridium] sordellii] [Paeniclostridium sordellii]CEN69151.1 DNA-directed DNA polymerase [[Clostridium] sordellii] [Paeniclostridium sordellii]CEN72419.1 DNA-directed DNA polymerase [[Clostridium] sordellii] [Paeniclostridium sordellii]CEO23838.1 DNA-directed DNA polymerase [[Clostridium] sordellii] [Paeniclostridium sordellii]CEP75988.1 DNA-directed DNA polymerase [[Clostridium] sordellii] [Paeniclost
MKTISIDIETYSNIDLTKSGVYKYIEGDFEILLIAYAYDDEEVKIIDLKNGDKIPPQFKKDLFDENIIKTAFNANFERICLSKYFNKKLSPKMFRCTQVHGLYLGLPHGLDKVSKTLRLKEEKLEEGKSLIRFFMKKENIDLINSKEDSKEKLEVIKKYEAFKKYCINDVVVERSIRKFLEKVKIPKIEQKLWELDQEINDRGVLIDKKLLENACTCDEKFKEDLMKKLKIITKVDNPKSNNQIKTYLKTMGIEVSSLNKESVENLLKSEEVLNHKKYEEIKEVLNLRSRLNKTSTKKYEAMKRCICSDDRIRGLFQFYGANRTGRWAGRLVQVQNLPQNKLENLEEVRSIIINNYGSELPSRDKYKKYTNKENYYNQNKSIKVNEDISSILSQLIRTTFIPKKNHRFIIADFSAIEARITSYIANEIWRLEVFNTHGKIYEASAAKMFKVDINKITKESELRQKGKIAELALGYQGGVGALVTMGAYNMNLCEDELIEIVKAFRSSNTNIVSLWKKAEKAFIKAVKDKTVVNIDKNISFIYEGNILFIKLPSGRRLSYIRPRVDFNNAFNKYIITYEGLDSISKKQTRLTTYGGKLVENIVQAIARDVLGYAMLNLKYRKFNIVMHVHDEIVVEVENNISSVEEVCEIMCEENPYLKDLKLKADGFESRYYKK